MEEIKIPKEVQQKKSAEIVASIDDLLIVILLRLPVKSLLRFKSVSKHWLSLIANPKFCCLRNRTVGLMLERKTDIPKAVPFFEYVPFFETALTNKLDYYEDADSTDILQSCNGLLLCFSYCTEVGSFILKNCRYYVCNPSTYQLSLVPLLEDDDNWCNEMSLAFDPAISSHYKVVCVRKLQENLTQIFIYSSVTNAWEVCGDPFTFSIFSFSDGVYWNGAVHWMECKRHLYFKIEDHVLHEMPKTPFSNNWTDTYYFGESCDHLHFVETLATHIQFNVYEIKRDYSEWFIKYQVDLSPVVAAYPEMIQAFNHPTVGSRCYNYSVRHIVRDEERCYNYSVCCIVRDEEKEKGEEESFLVLQIPEKVVQLDLNHKTFRILQELEGSDIYGESNLHECQGELRYQYTNGFQYIESLCKI